MLLLTAPGREVCYLAYVITLLCTSLHKGVLMEFLPALGVVLGGYVLFVLVFFKFLGIMHRKDASVLRQGGVRS